MDDSELVALWLDQVRGMANTPRGRCLECGGLLYVPGDRFCDLHKLWVPSFALLR